MAKQPLEAITADTSRLTDTEIDQLIVLLMRCVTRTGSLNMQRFLVGMVRDLTNVALARDEVWIGLAPLLEEIQEQM